MSMAEAEKPVSGAPEHEPTSTRGPSQPPSRAPGHWGHLQNTRAPSRAPRQRAHPVPPRGIFHTGDDFLQIRDDSVILEILWILWTAGKGRKMNWAETQMLVSYFSHLCAISTLERFLQNVKWHFWLKGREGSKVDGVCRPALFDLHFVPVVVSCKIGVAASYYQPLLPLFTQTQAAFWGF